MINRVILLAVAAMIQLWALPVTATMKDACNQDIKTYCDGVKRGGGRIMNCLKAHSNEISPACKSAINDSKAACEPDRQKFCANVEEGQGRIMECLKQHKSELSEACRNATK